MRPAIASCRRSRAGSARQCASSETFARLGGDEFGILLSPGSEEDATALAARIHGALETPFYLSGFPLEIAVSVGIAAYPEHGEDVDTLLQHADVAMYVAKDGHAGTALYESEQDTSDAARLALAGELRGAIDNDELVVHFQPKAELESGLIVGVEALVRWQHPERGFIPPNEFIPIAERTGLIKPLSQYVVAAALRQCGEWRAAGFDLHVAVNLTIPDLLDLELPDRIGELLAETGVRPGQLELEVTETTILADPFRVRQVLNRLNEMGLRLAIDDFGTGYSSLAYLKNLPVHTIKIDRSFVMGMCEDASDATIVRSTIDLGRNLGLGVVAEGIETQEVWDALRADGCSLAQGYFISRPASAEYLKPILEERALRTRDGVASGLLGLNVAAGEDLLDLVVQRALVVDQLLRQLAGLLEQPAVAAQTREAKLREPRLARAEELALAADLEIDLGELEPVVRGHERLQPGERRVGQLLLRPRDEQAVRLLGAPPHPASQLVQLGEAEPVGLLDDHDRRVRDVDADLDHRRRHQDVELPGLEARHQIAAVGGLEPAVEQADAVALELALLQPLGLALCGAGD